MGALSIRPDLSSSCRAVDHWMQEGHLSAHVRLKEVQDGARHEGKRRSRHWKSEHGLDWSTVYVVAEGGVMVGGGRRRRGLATRVCYPPTNIIGQPLETFVN